MQPYTKSLLALIALMGCFAGRVQAAPGTTEEQLLGVLQSDAPATDKAWACRELKRVGTQRSVAPLSAFLTDKALSHSARYALEGMPYPEVGTALREALPKAEGLTKVGIIDTLGRRHDQDAVPLLIPLLQDSNAQIVSSAAVALGKIATPEAAAALSAAWEKATPQVRESLGEGYVLLADHLAQTGQADAAAKIFQALSGPAESRPVRLAALRGIFQAAGDKRYEMIVHFLASTDADAWATAAGQIKTLTDGQLRSLAAELPRLPATSQAAILAALAIRGDTSQLSLVVEASRSKDAAVRMAAIRALGQLGDASVVPSLIETMFSEGEASDAARRSLEALGGAGVDEKIIAALAGEQELSRRGALIALLDARRTVAGIPALLKEAAGANGTIRGQAMAVLGRLAAPGDVAGMIAVVLKLEPGPEREEAEKAVMFVCQRISDVQKRADPVLAVFAGADGVEKAALLPLLGRVGTPKALEAVRAMLAHPNLDIHAAAVRAICNWPDASVAPQLLELAQTAEPAEQRIWALRGFIRVVSLPSKTPEAKKIASLRQALQLAARDEERGLALQRMATIRSMASFEFIVGYLDQPALAEYACRAVVDVAHDRGLRGAHKVEFTAALQRVLKISKDADTLQHAQIALREM
jgi:HEAT repeat protein